MGRNKRYITADEAGRILKISPAAVHILARQKILDAHYPETRKQQRFIEEEVRILAEVRKDTEKGFTQKLPVLAMRAIVSSRRMEQRVKEIYFYLGIDDEVLSTETKDILELHTKMKAWVVQPFNTDNDLLQFSRVLLAVTEEYLECVSMALKTHEPWVDYFAIGDAMNKIADPSGRMYSFVQHSRRSLRNSTFFFIHGKHGPAAAKRALPGVRFTDQLLNTRH